MKGMEAGEEVSLVFFLKKKEEMDLYTTSTVGQETLTTRFVSLFPLTSTDPIQYQTQQ